MSELNAVVKWKEANLIPAASGHWSWQVGHADEAATQHRPGSEDGWHLHLRRDHPLDDWWLQVALACMPVHCNPLYPPARWIIHATPTGTRSLAEARAIAAAVVVALQRHWSQAGPST